jgi:DNA repair exonuclease SbcCD ATPase subunit
MNDHLEDNGQFKLRSEDLAETAEKAEIPAEINELRLEKISQRVTLISIMIPVLIVIVLVITYLDIKKRVVRTEDTGMIEFQKLSADLESRFSSLSVRQAKLEDDMTRMIAQSDQSAAAIQVRLQKLQETLTQVQQGIKNKIDKKELNSTRDELVRQINGLVDASNQASEQMAAITTELKKQMDQLTANVAATEQRMVDVDRLLAEIEKNKIDKPAMDLAMQQTIDALKKQIGRATQPAPAPPASPKPSAQQAPSTGQPPTKPPSSAIEEQTISR